jgi:hypothetical protein
MGILTIHDNIKFRVSVTSMRAGASLPDLILPHVYNYFGNIFSTQMFALIFQVLGLVCALIYNMIDKYNEDKLA